MTSLDDRPDLNIVHPMLPVLHARHGKVTVTSVELPTMAMGPQGDLVTKPGGMTLVAIPGHDIKVLADGSVYLKAEKLGGDGDGELWFPQHRVHEIDFAAD